MAGFGSVLAASVALLGASRGLFSSLGPVFGLLGAAFWHLGRVLGRFVATSAHSWPSWRRCFGLLGPFWGQSLAAWVLFVPTGGTTWVICSPSTQYDPSGTTCARLGVSPGASADFGKFKYVQILCFPEGRTRRTTTRASPQGRGRSQRKGAAVRRRRRLRLKIPLKNNFFNWS